MSLQFKSVNKRNKYFRCLFFQQGLKPLQYRLKSVAIMHCMTDLVEVSPRKNRLTKKYDRLSWIMLSINHTFI